MDKLHTLIDAINENSVLHKAAKFKILAQGQLARWPIGDTGEYHYANEQYMTFTASIDSCQDAVLVAARATEQVAIAQTKVGLDNLMITVRGGWEGQEIEMYGAPTYLFTRSVSITANRQPQ